MKVTNWRRKLMASLVAAGLMSPAAARAADLNTNLIVDPSFENVDPANVGPFMSNRLLDWPDTALDGNATDDNWAFRFAQNYAGVNTPAGAGSRYFSGGFGTTVGQATLAQSVGVSTGASGTRIVLHLLKTLKRTGKKKGMASICIGGGLGGAMLVEAL